jgi:uncharacterized membrane protein YkvI
MGRHTLAEDAPTQSRYPWRATARTVVAFLIAILPSVAVALGDGSEQAQTGAAAVALPIVAGVTRFLAMPGVDEVLRRFLPILATEPKG